MKAFDTLSLLPRPIPGGVLYLEPNWPAAATTTTTEVVHKPIPREIRSIPISRGNPNSTSFGTWNSRTRLWRRRRLHASFILEHITGSRYVSWILSMSSCAISSAEHNSGSKCAHRAESWSCGDQWVAIGYRVSSRRHRSKRTVFVVWCGHDGKRSLKILLWERSLESGSYEEITVVPVVVQYILYTI